MRSLWSDLGPIKMILKELLFGSVSRNQIYLLSQLSLHFPINIMVLGGNLPRAIQPCTSSKFILISTALLSLSTTAATREQFYFVFLSDPSPIIGNACQWLTNWLTDSCLVNLIDVTLACEDANSKLVDVVTIADDDRVGINLLQIWKLRFGHKA